MARNNVPHFQFHLIPLRLVMTLQLDLTTRTTTWAITPPSEVLRSSYKTISADSVMCKEYASSFEESRGSTNCFVN